MDRQWMDDGNHGNRPNTAIDDSREILGFHIRTLLEMLRGHRTEIHVEAQGTFRRSIRERLLEFCGHSRQDPGVPESEFTGPGLQTEAQLQVSWIQRSPSIHTESWILE